MSQQSGRVIFFQAKPMFLLQGFIPQCWKFFFIVICIFLEDFWAYKNGLFNFDNWISRDSIKIMAESKFQINKVFPKDRFIDKIPDASDEDKERKFFHNNNFRCNGKFD